MGHGATGRDGNRAYQAGDLPGAVGRIPGPSVQEAIEEHKRKIFDYLADPWASDIQGRLANAPTREIQEKIIAGRVEALQKQLRKQ